MPRVGSTFECDIALGHHTLLVKGGTRPIPYSPQSRPMNNRDPPPVHELAFAVETSEEEDLATDAPMAAAAGGSRSKMRGALAVSVLHPENGNYGRAQAVATEAADHAEDSSSSSSVLDSSDYDEVSSDVSDPAYDTYGMQRRSYAAVQARGSGGGHASGGGNRGSGSSVHGSTPRARASTAGNSEYDSHLERARSSTAGKGKDLLNAALGHVQSVVRLSRGGGERASRRKSDGRSGGGGRGSKKAKANARHARPRRHPPLLPEQLPEKSGQIHIAQPHRCDLEQCKRKLGAFTETLQKYHVACTWSGGTAALKGVALKGTIDIEEARVMVKLKLSFVVPREKLRKSILKRLRKADFANP